MLQQYSASGPWTNRHNSAHVRRTSAKESERSTRLESRRTVKPDHGVRTRVPGCCHVIGCYAKGGGQTVNRECFQRHSEVRAGRLSSRFTTFRLKAYRTVQTRPVSTRVEAYTTGFSQTSIFIPSPFSGRTNGASRREQVSALFFVA